MKYYTAFTSRRHGRMTLRVSHQVGTNLQNVDSKPAIRDIQVTLALAAASVDARNKQLKLSQKTKEEMTIARNSVSKYDFHFMSTLILPLI